MIHRKYKHKQAKGLFDESLRLEQKESNHHKSKTRARVEHIFRFIENGMHG